MLERTAATLEACNLQRVLHKQVRSVKTRRQLHTAFWQHGAAALEVASLWPVLPQAVEIPVDDGALQGQQQQPTALVASVFLLDFLYPKSTHSLLRRFYPAIPVSNSRSESVRHVHRRRHIASSASAAAAPDATKSANNRHSSNRFQQYKTSNSLRKSSSPQKSSPAEKPVSQFSGDAETRHNLPSTPPNDTTSQNPPTKDEPVAYSGAPRASLNAVIRQAQYDATRLDGTDQVASATRLMDLISSEYDGNYHQVWDLYCRLSRDDQGILRPHIIIHFSKSSGIVEIGRALSLFRQVSPNQWNDELLAIIVQLYLRSDDAAYAAKKLREGLKHRLVGGLDDLVADCINKQNWDLLIETWLSFSASRAAVDSSDDLVDRRKIRHLAKLASVDDIGGRYLLLAKYLATDDVSSKYTDRKSKDALENLKHRLSRAAIKQPCPPEQASVILKSRNDHGLYYEYFRRILPRQKDKKMRSPTHTLHLTEIYKEYRQMPEAKPSKQLLHGVFNLAFPSDVPTLMALYQDWKKFMGEFDQMAYMRFLTFFAKLGDVKAVQDLWKQFITDYPRALQRPSAFNSIVNVYAQAGDFESAEKELKVMQDQYGLTPCLDTMNMVLKSYVKAGNYQGAMDCYERIQKTYKPDSYTFAHVMAISAKRGDVENTLDLFKRSQKSDASPTKEMALALVLAYCRNDKLAEAERICIQLAERKVTSVAVWNLLINHNGMQGNLPSCYRLLQLMKRYGLQWNDQTHEFLFQALAKADQLQAAHNLLRRAQKSKLFMVTPEHYAIVMTAAVRLGDFAAVESMAAQMQQAGLTMNFNAHVAYMRAYISQTPEPARLKVLIRVLVDHVKAMVPKLEEPITDRIDNALVEPDHLDTAYLDMEHTDIDLTEADMAESDGKVTASVSIGDPRVLGVQTQQFAQAILLLTELKDYDTLDELIDLHSTIFPATKNLGSLPPSVASAIMAAYYKRNQLKRVLDLWRQVWDDTLSRAKDAKGNIYPAYQFSLNRPLHLVIFSYRRQNNGMGLLHCIRQVTSTGFKLTTSNWEMAIRYLAEMGQWERAVEWCESILMPLWAGWRQRKPALEARWKLKNAHAIKPPSEAVIETLHHEWLEMQKLAAWSPEVSTKLKGFSTQFPKLHHAMLTAASKKMLNSVETSTRQSLKKAIDKMISVYSLDELKTLKRILGDDLQSTLSKAARYRRIAAMRARAASTGVDPSTIPKHGRERALSLYYTIKSRVENQQKAGKTNPKIELTQDATASETTTGGDTSTSPSVSEDAKANSFTPANKSEADITRAASTDTAASERERPRAPDATVLGADSPSSTNTTMIRNNRPPTRLRSAYLRRRQIPGEGVRTATPLSATAGGSGS